ncbi:hypothetical protein [Winogradskyella helgolandensis]|uniref:hypothetical protein n=1 Tax=Winogradskyella helgolandensis TaxID=2697010 RepID=UPI0018A2C0D5|nr:hypothetical protein [Winogradskyella helgolandensis]
MFLKIINTYYSDKPFAYITLRVNSYSVNPEIDYKIPQIESLNGFSVVTSNYQAKTKTQIEKKMVFKKPFEIKKIEDTVARTDKFIGVK